MRNELKNTIQIQYKSINTMLRKLGLGVFGLAIIFLVSFSVLTLAPLNANAQDANAGTVGFSKCQFNSETQGSGDVSIQDCLGQIFQFTFVIGMFVIAIRVALFALGNYNPFDNGRATNDTIKIVWEATLGFILLGSPVLIINVINPAALNLSFLNLGNLAINQNTGGTGNTTGGASTTGGNSSGSAPIVSTIGGDILSSDLQEAIDNLQPGSEQVTPPVSKLENNLAYVSNVIGLSSPTAYAQQDMSDSEAIQIVSNFLLAELQCSKIFITQVDYTNCQALDSPDFVMQRNRINQRTRELYTPLIEPSRSYSGSLYNSRSLTVLPIILPAGPTNLPDCTLNYAIIQESNSNSAHLIATEYCQGDQFSSQIWEKSANSLVPRSDATIEAGSQIVQNGSIQILN